MVLDLVVLEYGLMGKRTASVALPSVNHRIRSVLMGLLALVPPVVAAQDCGLGDVFTDGFEASLNLGGGASSTAYWHVTPQDAGLSIGVGVVAAVPTELYVGDNTITAPMLIENRIINTCLRIESDDVTIRNSIIQCNGLYPIRISNGSRHVTIEYNQIHCGSNSKLFYVPSGAPDALISHNVASGCEDFFFMQGDLDGLSIVNNYIHSLNGTAASHADGLQIGEAGVASGRVYLRGNYFDPNNSDVGINDLLFATNDSAISLLMEDNYIARWGHYTLRCGGTTTACTIRNNVFDQAFSGVEQRVLLATSSADAQFCCNRYADGQLLEELIEGTDLVLGADHHIENCPSF